MACLTVKNVTQMLCMSSEPHSVKAWQLLLTFATLLPQEKDQASLCPLQVGKISEVRNVSWSSYLFAPENYSDIRRPRSSKVSGHLRTGKEE